MMSAQRTHSIRRGAAIAIVLVEAEKNTASLCIFTPTCFPGATYCAPSVFLLPAGTDSEGSQALMGNVEYLTASLSVLNTTIVSHTTKPG